MNLVNINKSDCCCGMTDTQCFVFVEIGNNPDISIKELANLLHVDKSFISRLVEDLVQKEYVARTPAKTDRRYVMLNLTSKGMQRFNKIENDMNIRFQNILDKIPEEKRDQVIESLELYNIACQIDENNNDNEIQSCKTCC